MLVNEKEIREELWAPVTKRNTFLKSECVSICRLDCSVKRVVCH